MSEEESDSRRFALSLKHDHQDMIYACCHSFRYEGDQLDDDDIGVIGKALLQDPDEDFSGMIAILRSEDDQLTKRVKERVDKQGVKKELHRRLEEMCKDIRREEAKLGDGAQDPDLSASSLTPSPSEESVQDRNPMRRRTGGQGSHQESQGPSKTGTGKGKKDQGRQTTGGLTLSKNTKDDKGKGKGKAPAR